MAIYRKRPPEIEARPWDGTPESTSDILDWMGEYITDGPEGSLVEQIITDMLGAAPGDYIVCDNGSFVAVSEGLLLDGYEEVIP